MLRVGCGTLLVLSALSAPAFAQGNCIEPYAPVIPAADMMSEEQILSVQAQVRAFIADSDSYQRCLEVYVRQIRDEAEREREPADTTTITRIVRMIEANQRQKVRVGEEYNTVVRAYNALHNPAPEASPPSPEAADAAAVDPADAPAAEAN